MSDLPPKSKQQLAIQRAADDLRRGWPVVVRGEGKALLVMPAESANSATLAHFENLASEKMFLMVTGNRAQALKVGAKGWPVVRLEKSSWLSAADIVAIADPTLDLSNPFKGPFKRIDTSPALVDEAAIKLAKIARLLPALIAAETSSTTADALEVEQGLIGVEHEAVLKVDHAQTDTLKIVATASVPIEATVGTDIKTQLVSFRPEHGNIEHIAIVVGDPSRHEPVLARLHSECFTGDLLGSLKCDCGDQLKGAIKHIAKAGGGVVLYMAQEGRGIGLTSKLKAYSLQDQGYDTVDANTALGFDVDERFFAPAASMLKQLGFSSVRLMTNNPNKVEAMAKWGVEVAERVAHSFPPNPHNVDYLATKRDRTGHIL